MQEGKVSLTSLRTLWDPELEYLEARLDANADERDGIAEKMSELYLSDRFAEMDYLNGRLRSCLDESYDIRDRIGAIVSLRERASAIDTESEKLVGELSLHPCDDSTSVTAASEKASAKSEEVVGELSLDLRDDSTSVAALELEEVVIPAPLAKAPEFPPTVAVGCAPVRFTPFLSRVFPCPTDRWHRSVLSVEDLISGLLRLRIYARIRLIYYSLKMSRIKWSKKDIWRMNWNFLSAFC